MVEDGFLRLDTEERRRLCEQTSLGTGLPVSMVEKAMLLHEESFRPPDRARPSRLSRHYYDLWCLIRRGIGAEAVRDDSLFDRVASHREVFWGQSWVNYRVSAEAHCGLRRARISKAGAGTIAT